MSESESLTEFETSWRAIRGRKRMRRWMVAGLFLAVAFGPYLFFRAASFSERVRTFENPNGDAARQPVTDSLRVMSWNIAHGRGIADSNWAESATAKVERVMKIGALIRKQNADIVVLNEVDFSATWSGGFDQAKAIAKAAGFKYYAQQTNLDFGFIYGRFKFGNVILSHYPIVDAVALDLPPFAEWEDWLAGRKRGLHCTIALKTKRGTEKIGVMAMHLEVRGEKARNESVDYLVEKIAESKHPLILAGDLNTTPSRLVRLRRGASSHDGVWDNAFDRLERQSDLTRVPNFVDSASQLTFPSTSPVVAIDWIFFDDSFWSTAKSYRVLQTQLSDHLPVLADLQFRRP